MISATSILITGDTASVVGTEWWATVIMRDAQNRPCDNREWIGGSEPICPDCDGTGRYMFDIEVATPEGNGFGEFIDAFRVHVIDVLPIVDGNTWEYTDDWMILMSDGRTTLYEPLLRNGTDITLPLDAAPGMWLVRLAVHS